MTALAFLSLARTHTGRNGVPQVPTNDQRVHAFRAFQPVQFANAAMTEKFRAIDYARLESLDGSIPTTEIYEENA
jgi:hypothetical protein